MMECVVVDSSLTQAHTAQDPEIKSYQSQLDIQDKISILFPRGPNHNHFASPNLKSINLVPRLPLPIPHLYSVT